MLEGTQIYLTLMEFVWKGFVPVLTFSFRLGSSTPCVVQESHLLSCEPVKVKPLFFWLQSRKMTALKLHCYLPVWYLQRAAFSSFL